MIILLIVLIAIASAMALFWLFLLFTVNNEDITKAAYNKVLQNLYRIQFLQGRDAENRALISQYSGVPQKLVALFHNPDSSKEINKLTVQSQQIQSGYFRYLNPFILPGYAIQRRFDKIGRGVIHKELLIRITELYGRKHAENQTAELMAGILSYPLIGLSVSFMLGAIFLALELTNQGLIVLGVGSILVLVLVYAMYDEVSDRLNKRREEIARDFPNVVSKLALLVSSGMIVPKAWIETSSSGYTVLYQEMRKTSEELDQNMSPEAVYGNFITRCNTKETAKLASAILQSLSKGNSEIGALLRDLAKESWQERKHGAKRNAEKANARLIIPSMLLFIAILVIIMVPVATSFSSL